MSWDGYERGGNFINRPPVPKPIETESAWQRLVIEDPRDEENNAIFCVHTDRSELTVVVSEEQAVDSWNRTFTCSFDMNREQAILLRDFLIRNLG